MVSRTYETVIYTEEPFLDPNIMMEIRRFALSAAHVLLDGRKTLKNGMRKKTNRKTWMKKTIADQVRNCRILFIKSKEICGEISAENRKMTGQRCLRVSAV